MNDATSEDKAKRKATDKAWAFDALVVNIKRSSTSKILLLACSSSSLMHMNKVWATDVSSILQTISEIHTNVWYSSYLLDWKVIKDQ